MGIAFLKKLLVLEAAIFLSPMVVEIASGICAIRPLSQFAENVIVTIWMVNFACMFVTAYIFFFTWKKMF